MAGNRGKTKGRNGKPAGAARRLRFSPPRWLGSTALALLGLTLLALPLVLTAPGPQPTPQGQQASLRTTARPPQPVAPRSQADSPGATPPAPQAGVTKPGSQQPAGRPAALHAPAPAIIAPPASPSEVDGLSRLEAQAREVDMALLEALADIGLGPDSLRFTDVRRLEDQGRPYQLQALDVAMAAPARGAFPAALARRLAQRAPHAAMAALDGSLEVSLDGLATHRLHVLDAPTGASPDAPADAPVDTPDRSPLRAPGGRARLVIVIDDLGEDLHAATQLAAMDLPLVFAIWPKATHTSKTLDIARRAGREAIMHQPMEAIGHNMRSLGRGALFTRMDEAAIRAQLDENLAGMPGVLGLNNHMGSIFTADPAGMRAVLGLVRERGLLFLDSVTIGNSVAGREARGLGMSILRRDVFLDHVIDTRTILGQLRRAEAVALRFGRAIAIGHPHPQTLAALRAWSASRDRRVELAAISEILPEGHPLLARHGKSQPGS